MTAETKGLTERLLKEVEPPTDRQSVFIYDRGNHGVAGFGARVWASGSVSFIVDFRVNGRAARWTIGKWPTWSVRAARTKAAEILQQAQRGIDPRAVRRKKQRADSLTLRNYLNGPYAEHQQHKKSGQQTLAMINKSFAQLLARPLQQIRREDIRTWRRRREADGLQWLTIKRHFDALQGLLNHAVREEALKENPLGTFRLTPPASSEADQLEAVANRKILNDAEIRQFFCGLGLFNEEKKAQRRRSRQHGKRHLPCLDKVRFAHAAVPWFLLAYYTGLRPGDLFGLQWPHVDLERKQIVKVIEKTAAHNSRPMAFPLAPDALEALTDWWHQNDRPVQGYVFASDRTGGRRDKHSMQRPWAQIKEMGGLPPELQIYTLRHNFASQLIQRGVDLFTVSRLMAHSDIQTTINNYASFAPDHAAAAVANLPGGAT